MYCCELLTLTLAAQQSRDSCMAMRQKAVMDSAESVPYTSPYTWTYTQGELSFLLFLFSTKIKNFCNCNQCTHSNPSLVHSSNFCKLAVRSLGAENQKIDGITDDRGFY